MTCDVCKQSKPSVAWHSDARGTLALCDECIHGMQRGLRDLLERMATCSDLRSLLEAILDAAIATTHADMGNIQLLDKDGVLRIRAQRGFSEEFLAFFSGVHESEAACGWALATRKTVAVEDVEQSAIFIGQPSLRILLNARVQAVQSTPMFNRSGDLIGVFSTHYHHARKMSEEELRLASYLAWQAADLIEKLSAPR